MDLLLHLLPYLDTLLPFLYFLRVHESLQLLGSDLQKFHDLVIRDDIVFQIHFEQVLDQPEYDFLINSVLVDAGS